MHMIRYCSLLTRGANLQPGATAYPSTAADALRHWTPEQKARLEKCDKGKKLLDVENKQQEEWKQKYNTLSAREKENMTYENFQWAMEAVNSRAFRGDFGGESLMQCTCSTFYFLLCHTFHLCCFMAFSNGISIGWWGGWTSA